jgi:hypothetical protein
MKFHNRFSYLWPKYPSDHVRALLREDALVAARVEPVYSIRFEAFLDCAFERAGQWMVLPMIRVDSVALMSAENPALAWPTMYQTCDRSALSALEMKIVPWLRSLTIGRLVNDEAIRFFRDEPALRAVFEQARANTWLGAAPYPAVLKTSAAAVYAMRFARGRSVVLDGEGAPNGAAILSGVAGDICVACDAAVEFEQECVWFSGLTLSRAEAGKTYDLRVGSRMSALKAAYEVVVAAPTLGEREVRVTEPIPTDVMLSYDVEDGPHVASLAVKERSVPLRRSVVAEPAATGQSRGCIRIVVRDEAFRFSDADLDAARALERRLLGQGFDAAVCDASSVEVSQADIIHVFDLRHGVAMVKLLRDAETAGVPVVVTPYADDRKAEAIPGASASLLIPRVTNDLVTFEDYTRALALRRISNLTQGAWYHEASVAVLARSAAAIVSSKAEGDFLTERFGYGGLTFPVAATVPTSGACADIGALVGPDEYILIHGPLEPRMNQLFAVVGAQRHGLPLVLLGPVGDVEFYRYLNEVVGPGSVLLRDDGLSEEEIAGVYARARVAADVSWSARGLHRLARGAAAGAALVAPSQGYARDLWGDLVELVDPGNLDSVAQGLLRAWNRQPEIGSRIAVRTAERCDPFAGLVATVEAYRQASAKPTAQVGRF